MVRRILLIGTMQMLFWSCSDQRQRGHQTLNIDLRGYPDENAISIDNSSDVPLRFTLLLNGRFPVTEEMLLAQLNVLGDSLDIDQAEAGWIFVSTNTFHSNSISSEPWVHDPLLFLNSVGGGLCDDRNSVLAGVWNYLGLNSRVIGLEGHVVSEVEVHGQWVMFDADHGIYFRDHEGNRLSVEAISGSVNDSITVVGSDLTSAFLWDFRRFRLQKQWQNYRSTYNNVDMTDWHIGFDRQRTQAFILPPKSRMNIIDCGSETVIQVELSETSKGELDVPLVAFATSGELEFQRGQLPQKSHSERTLVEMSSAPFEIISAENGAAIWFRANPLLCDLQPINTLTVNVTEGSSPTIGTHTVDSIFLDLNMRDALMVRKYLRSSFDNFTTIGSIDGMMNYDHLIDRLEALSLEDELSSAENTGFRAELDAICDTLGISQAQLFNESKTNYPMSLVMLHVIVKYRMFDYAKAMYSGGNRLKKVGCRS